MFHDQTLYEIVHIDRNIETVDLVLPGTKNYVNNIPVKEVHPAKAVENKCPACENTDQSQLLFGDKTFENEGSEVAEEVICYVCGNEFTQTYELNFTAQYYNGCCIT